MTPCGASTGACSFKATKVQKAQFSVALVGNPNCGKTTLFNALAGTRQKVGNWPGVTVERKSGYFVAVGTTVKVTDLPGVYALTLSAEAALDERIACEYILQHEADVVVNIVDASNLERHLYLTLQLLEMGVPVVVALNMMDIARTQCIEIDVAELSRKLGCPVVALEANRKGGIEELKHVVVEMGSKLSTHPRDACGSFSHQGRGWEVVGQGIAALSTQVKDDWVALRLLENDREMRALVPEEVMEQVKVQQAHIQQTMGQGADELMAAMRYDAIQAILQQVLRRTTKVETSWTEWLDNIALNRWLGIPIFLGVMYCLFVFAIGVGGIFQDFFDRSGQWLFVDMPTQWLTTLGAPTWLIALIADGIGKGINTTTTFIPVIGAMFLFLSFLEDSGYMARAAFVMDRLMRMLGLPGKAFVPMIVGFGCNVPAIMAARTLDNKRDRILTIMMIPFMSCGARLTIYAVFASAFFTHGAQNIVFALYLIGIAMAVLTGLMLRTNLLPGEPAPLIMELPLYHVPYVRTLLLHAWQRLQGFVFRAGKVIVPVCVLIGVLNALNVDGSLNLGDGDVHSLLSVIGQWMTPIFAPMGIQADNWPATVGLVTGILAKEVVVGTLNTLYSQIGHVAALHQDVYGLMAQKFDGQIGAFAYLLFVLLYFPCVSTMGVMLRELHKGWVVFSAVWMTGVAYGVAVMFYQAATWTRHPLTSALWVGGIALGFALSAIMLRWVSGHETTVRGKNIQEAVSS